MSRSLPASERRPLDAYYTPDDLALALVATLPVAGAVCWEPHAGGGAFVRALTFHGAEAVIATDIAGGAWGGCRDFLTEPMPPVKRLDWIVGNPPFTGFAAHVEHALAQAPNVAFLLRLAVMESAQRIECWRSWPLLRVYVLAERPSFTGGGTDSAAYGWFIFRRGYTGRAEIVPGWSWKGSR